MSCPEKLSCVVCSPESYLLNFPTTAQKAKKKKNVKAWWAAQPDSCSIFSSCSRRRAQQTHERAIGIHCCSSSVIYAQRRREKNLNKKTVTSDLILAAGATPKGLRVLAVVWYGDRVEVFLPKHTCLIAETESVDRWSIKSSQRGPFPRIEVRIFRSASQGLKIPMWKSAKCVREEKERYQKKQNLLVYLCNT